MQNLEFFKIIFPYLIQLGVGIGAALMVFKIRLIKIESRLYNQEKVVEELKKDTKSEFDKLNEKLEKLVTLFGELKESVSSIDGYLQGRKEKAAEIALKRAKKKV